MFKMGINTLSSGRRPRGFTILEVVVSLLVLLFVASSTIQVTTVCQSLFKQNAHRIVAIEFAASAARELMARGASVDAYRKNPNIAVGTHTNADDPAVCELPDCFFKNALNGKLTYTISEKNIDTYLTTVVAEVKVTWTEIGQPNEAKESLYTIVYCYKTPVR